MNGAGVVRSEIGAFLFFIFSTFSSFYKRFWWFLRPPGHRGPSGGPWAPPGGLWAALGRLLGRPGCSSAALGCEAATEPRAIQRKSSASQPEPRSRQRSELSSCQEMGLDLLDLLFVAVLIHNTEVTHGRRVVLAVGWDKLCSQASLASVPFSGPYALCLYVCVNFYPVSTLYI